jgi:Zn-dependent peptidase ImmA (M78 family)
MDAIGFNLKRLSREAIAKKAESKLRELHDGSIPIPTPIDDIIEGSGIKIIPITGLRNNYQKECFLTANCEEIYIDDDLYLNSGNRYKFTLAHELGHYFLHEELFKKILNYEALEKFYSECDENTLTWLETQANWYASFFLCPTSALKEEAKSIVEKTNGLKINKTREVYEYIADSFKSEISNKFQISLEAARIRIITLLEHKI